MERKDLKKYYELKAKYPDAILLFKNGDFYDAYCEDADECGRILGLVLSNPNGWTNVKYTSFPHHKLDTYLPKLVRTGHRVGICDKLENY